VLAGEQRGARRRALRHDVGIGETDALAREPIEMRRRDEPIAVAPERRPSLIVGQNEEDVGSRPIRRQ
jgi:hypothetical protein